MTQIEEEEETKLESLIREYQQNAVPDPKDLILMELYGGVEWRTDEGDDMKRCIRRILERELEYLYQKNSSEGTEGEIEETVGEDCREGQGVSGREEMVVEREEDKKEERPIAKEECNEPKGITTQESGESRGGGDEKITKKETRENNKEPEAGDKKTEENVEEISKVGEGWDRNLMSAEETTRGGGCTEKGWCTASTGEGRHR